MKLAIVSASDSKGGAARIAETLTKGLRARGHSVDFLVGHNDGGTVPSRELEGKSNATGLLQGIAQKCIHRSGMNNSGFLASFPRRVTNVNFSEYDLLHIHDPPALDLVSLPWLSRQCPLVWTIHSMAPLTGNCIYPFECEKWKAGCGHCPQFGNWPLDWLHRDASSWMLRLKKWSYNKTRLTAVGVSNWISDRIRESIFSSHPVATIQNAVDTQAFFQSERKSARKAIGLRDDQFAIAFATSSNPNDSRKGMDIVVEAAALLRDKQSYAFMPMAIGSGTSQLQSRLSELSQVRTPQHLDTPEQLSTYYSAADLVWHPSRADTSSMVSLEAMACGTPVIAAAVGGVPEVIGDAGILIPPEDAAKLAAETEALRANPQLLEQLAQRAAQRVVQHFNVERFVDDHESLYATILRSK
ncbi:MAG: glycosyltransferase [Planctomycetaceae bacterium]|nr:glycosyltransferase [Planctomycetaceae bacterium]